MAAISAWRCRCQPGACARHAPGLGVRVDWEIRGRKRLHGTLGRELPLAALCDGHRLRYLCLDRWGDDSSGGKEIWLAGQAQEPPTGRKRAAAAHPRRLTLAAYLLPCALPLAIIEQIS